MKQHISILGCGWLGLPLAEAFIASEHSINGSTRTPEKIDILQTKGLHPFLIDLEKPDDFSEFLNTDTLIILVTCKNIIAFERLIKAIEISTIKQVLFISSTSVYPNTNSEVTETSATNYSDIYHIEELFRNNSHFKSTIIRFGGLFGGTRKPGNFIRPNNIIPNPEGYVNLIHRDDCIQIIRQIISKNIWQNTFNACAPTHPKRGEFYTKEMAKVGRYPSILETESTSSYKIVNTDKLIRLLAYEFKYADLMSETFP